MRQLTSCFFAVITYAVAALTQPVTTGDSTGFGSVSGHVFLSDTNGPARGATVVLEPASSVESKREEAADPSTEPGRISMPGVQTLLDGSFLLAHVTPGLYYVRASSPGYLPAKAPGLSEDEADDPHVATRRLIMQSLPRIVVQANLHVEINITLERSASISGTVLYEDGSAATGLSVSAGRSRCSGPTINPRWLAYFLPGMTQASR